MKPREFWIKLFNEKNVLPQNRAASAWDKEQMEYNAQYHDCSKQHFYEEHVHVIEKSAYDRLEAMCESLRKELDELKNARVQTNTETL